jgi:hypothetical protein
VIEPCASLAGVRAIPAQREDMGEYSDLRDLLRLHNGPKNGTIRKPKNEAIQVTITNGRVS